MRSQRDVMLILLILLIVLYLLIWRISKLGPGGGLGFVLLMS
jgi:hypothetical protein